MRSRLSEQSSCCFLRPREESEWPTKLQDSGVDPGSRSRIGESGDFKSEVDPAKASSVITNGAELYIALPS
jgi:hypothetical protein